MKKRALFNSLSRRSILLLRLRLSKNPWEVSEGPQPL